MALGRYALRRVFHGVGRVRCEYALERHHVRAETRGMEVIALARPVIPMQRDGMRAVVTTESDLEVLEGDPLRLFCVPLRLLDLGDEARVHAIDLHHPCSGRRRTMRGF